jgi:hypothetical protein
MLGNPLKLQSKNPEPPSEVLNLAGSDSTRDSPVKNLCFYRFSANVGLTDLRVITEYSYRYLVYAYK